MSDLHTEREKKKCSPILCSPQPSHPTLVTAAACYTGPAPIFLLQNRPAFGAEEKGGSPPAGEGPGSPVPSFSLPRYREMRPQQPVSGLGKVPPGVGDLCLALICF